MRKLSYCRTRVKCLGGWIMTVFDLRCDRCGAQLPGPEEAMRFVYHPGDILLKDNSGLLCEPCWTAAEAWLGYQQPEGRCARCESSVQHSRSVHVLRGNDISGWQLCPEHAVTFLNQLRTVEPKLSVETLTLAGDWRAAQS
jgi:hypothetical protein